MVFFFPAFSSQEATASLEILAISTPLRGAGHQVCIVDSTITPNCQKRVFTELEDALGLAVSLVTRPMIKETDDVGISVSYPLPGTKFHQLVSSQLGPKANWSDGADLAMMFHGTYGTGFCRALADAIHAEVRDGDAHTAWQRVQQPRGPCPDVNRVAEEVA